MTLESSIVRAGNAWLVSQGCDVIRIGLEGLPDYLVVYAPGRHFWLEYKGPEGRLTRAQKVRIPHMRARGHEVFLPDSVEEVKAILRVKRSEK